MDQQRKRSPAIRNYLGAYLSCFRCPDNQCRLGAREYEW